MTAPAGGQLEREVERAVAVLQAGGLVAFPTETVYGLGADAGNEAAVRRIFEVKGRPADHPLIVHLAAAEQLADWAATVPATARVLAERAVAGTPHAAARPAARACSTWSRAAGRPSACASPTSRSPCALLGAFGGGVAAPSANRFGRVSPTTAAHVRGDLGADVDLVLDGGPCSVGVESTIVDCTTDPPTVLRPGGVSVDRIVEVLGAAGPDRGGRSVPGSGDDGLALRAPLPRRGGRRRRRRRGTDGPAALAGLSADLLAPSLGADDYARHLYGWLRDADERGLDVLVAVAPAGDGLGLAVRDRLSKAAAPRPTVEDAG